MRIAFIDRPRSIWCRFLPSLADAGLICQREVWINGKLEELNGRPTESAPVLEQRQRQRLVAPRLKNAAGSRSSGIADHGQPSPLAGRDARRASRASGGAGTGGRPSAPEDSYSQSLHQCGIRSRNARRRGKGEKGGDRQRCPLAPFFFGRYPPLPGGAS